MASLPTKEGGFFFVLKKNWHDIFLYIDKQTYDKQTYNLQRHKADNTIFNSYQNFTHLRQ